MNLKSAVALDDIVVPPRTSVRRAMEVLHQTGLEVVLVCDERGRLQAVLTDGDIRGAILAGRGLETPVEEVGNRRFTAAPEGTSRNDALQIMVDRGFKCLPVVDKDGRVIDLHSLRNVIRATRCPSWAVVMAGGKGERLGELTQAIPKPMLPIGDRPILEHIVNLLVAHGIRRIFLSVGYLGTMIADHFEDGSRFQCRIDYLHEDQPLGTGGALTLLPEKPADPLVVMNGDLLTNISITRLLQFHRSGGFAATMVLREHKVQVPFGVAEVEGVRVAKLLEKPSLKYRINTGIYVLDPSLIARIPQGKEFPITELFAGCIRGGEGVGAFQLQEEWHDIGLPVEYERLNKRQEKA